MTKYLVEQIIEDGAIVDRVIRHKTNSSSLPRGGKFIFVEGVETNYPKLYTDSEGCMSIIEDEQPKAIKAAYDSMVSDIYDEMENVFSTRNDVSASAFASTYEAMVKRPANYIDGDLGLADEAAVTTYAEAKLALADTYGVFRLKRIAQYEAEKAAILEG